MKKKHWIGIYSVMEAPVGSLTDKIYQMHICEA